MSGDDGEGILSKASPTPTVVGDGERIIYVRSVITLYRRVSLTADRSNSKTEISETLRIILSLKNGPLL